MAKEIKIKYMHIAELKAYKNNPRNNEEAVPFVANSIREFGFKNPVIIDADNVIVAGHTRVKAAKTLGMREVPCIVADDLTPEQIRAFRLADNKTAEIATWNIEALNMEIEEISGIDMQGFGFSPMDLPSDGDGGESVYTRDDMNDVNVYQEKYGVIVMCKDEAEQEQTYNKLHQMGYECKVVSV